MRKRAQYRGIVPKTTLETTSTRTQQEKQKSWAVRLPFSSKKKQWWVAVTLVSIFFLVLLLNTFFNASSPLGLNPDGTTVSERFYLAGPDPYYNMRIIENTIETGRYAFFSELDPLLNYPLQGYGGRGPLMNLLAIGLGQVFQLVMNPVDALGYAMQFLPALFGALLIFPVYYIGEAIFNKKVGIIAALLIALIPIHIGAGHGSAFTLFDHDSFNLFLYFVTYLFLIKAMKETHTFRSVLYAMLSGLSVAALAMVWVEARFLFTVLAIFAVVVMVIDIFVKKIEPRISRSLIIVFFTGIVVSLPVLLAQYAIGVTLRLSAILTLIVFVFGLYYYFLSLKKTPWVISFSVLIGAGVAALAFLYFVHSLVSVPIYLQPFRELATTIYGEVMYAGKISLTIAEAGAYSISRSVMSYGPALYWLAWVGFCLLLLYYVKEKWRRDYLLLLVLFLVHIWLNSTAGRFLNDAVPLFALLGGWTIWIVIDKINYKQMWRNIKNAGGGLHGIRKGVKVFHVLGILFVSVLVILPNALMAFDAAIPATEITVRNETHNMKQLYFGEDFSGAFGSSLYKERYWVDALSWLNTQNTHISDPAKRPAFMSWWDYGFFQVAVGRHPTVADNFQHGITPAANFKTATSEEEAVAVLITLLLEGDKKDNGGVLSDQAVAVLEKHLGTNNSLLISRWMTDPKTAPSYKAPIGEQYDAELSEQNHVGDTSIRNVLYHDIPHLITQTLDDEGVTWLYLDIQDVTGYSVRYYGVEGYDRDIFNIFGFLSDKSLVLPALRTRGDKLFNPEDDFIKILYTGYVLNPDGTIAREATWSADDINNMRDEDRRFIQITGTTAEYKDAYFDTMFYRTYLGAPPQKDDQGRNIYPQQQIPTYLMRHFAVVYMSPYPYYFGQSAVVIAKYYAGAFIEGSLRCNNTPLPFAQVIVFDEYGIPHDMNFTDAEGNFRLLVIGGNITLQFNYANEVFLKEITFNSTTDSRFYPISDDEAMRRTNYTRVIDFTVNLSTIEGFVYEDIDRDNIYDSDVDIPLSNVEIIITDEFFGHSIPSITTDENGYFILSNLYPSMYTLVALQDGFEIYNQTIPIAPDSHFINISKPQLAGVEGVVYFDANQDNTYTSGEEMSGVAVKLIYERDKRVVDGLTTDTTGRYAFSSLIPGAYRLNATVLNTTTGYYDYLKEQTITLTANTTSTIDISIGYAPITVHGYAKSNGVPIRDLFITFDPDTSVQNNTAQKRSLVTEDNGQYTGTFLPGYYNVTVYDSVDQGTYVFEGKLMLRKGEGIKTYDIALTKQSVTVTGRTTYNNAPIANLTIYFDIDYTVENITAVDYFTQADQHGFFTAELIPGSYDVYISEVVLENGVNVTYTHQGKLRVEPQDISVGRTYNIALVRQQ